MLRMGIAGIGSMAEEYIRLKQENKIKGCEICALCSRNRQHMQEIRERYHLENAELFTDYHAMLESGRIDAVMICTPHLKHVEMAEAAVQRDIHVLIEKPIGVFASEAEQFLQTLLEHPKVVSGVLYCRRTSKAYQKLHRIVEAKELGALKRVNWIITNLYRTEAYHRSQVWKGKWSGEGGGLMLTQASHQLDLLVWLLGMPEKLRAFCGCGVERGIEVENEVMIQMFYPKQMTTQFIGSSREFPGTNRLELSGSKGQIILEEDRRMIWRRLETDEREYSAGTDEIYGRIPYTEEIIEFDDSDNAVQQAAIVNNFIQAVCGKEKVLCPAREAVESLQIINGTYLSSWKNETTDIPVDAEEYRKAWRRAAKAGDDGLSDNK